MFKRKHKLEFNRLFECLGKFFLILCTFIDIEMITKETFIKLYY